MTTKTTKETMIKQKYKIGVQKFMEHIPFNQDKIRNSFIWVEATDEVNAVQEYNEVYDNYKDVHTYLILGNGKMTNVIKKNNNQRGNNESRSKFKHVPR